MSYESILIDKMIGRVVPIFKERGATVAVAESCTGGRLAAAFTAAAGASEYFLGGVVAYSNEVKIEVLGVKREVIESHGAVSGKVAEQMASGVRRLMKADYAIATTGVAGPGGGTAQNPVGTLWVAIAGPDGVEARVFHFDGTRTENMENAVWVAISLSEIMI